MKHVFLYPLISILTIGVSGVGSYLYQGFHSKNNKTSTSEPDDSDDEPGIEEQEEPGFSKMINKLMATKEVKAKNADFTIKSTGNEDIYLNISNLDLDLAEALSGNISSMKMNGELKVKYREIDESMSLRYESNMLYINYQNKGYSFDAPKSIAGIVPILSTLNISLPTISTPDIDMSEILNNAMGILETVEEKQTDNGYEYILNCDDFLQNLNLPIDIHGVKLALLADADYNFVGGKTIGDGINIEQDYALKIDVNQIALSSNSQYQGLDENEKQNYTDLTNRTSNLFTTFATLMNKKNFKACFNADISSNKESFKKQNITGNIQADLSKIKQDVSKGAYEISLQESTNNRLSNEIYAAYQDNNIYVKLNQLIKGKISTSTIDDLIAIISNEIKMDELPDVTDSINEIIKDTDFDKLLKGDLSVYRNFIQDFSTTMNGFVLAINAKAFGLGNYILKITLDDTTTDLTNGFTLKIDNFRYNDIRIDLSLDITPLDAVIFQENFANYKDYAGILPIFNTLSKLADERKLNTKYTFNLRNTNQGMNYLAEGEISADLSHLALDSDNNYYGDYRLKLNTNLNGFDHSLDFAYQQHNLYLKTDDFFKQYISDSEVGDIYDIINQDKEGTSNAFDGMNDVITSLVNNIKETYSLKEIEDYFSLDTNNVDKNITAIDINLPKLFQNSTLSSKISSLSLFINTGEDKIESIQVNGYKVNNQYKLDFNLEIEDDFTPFTLSEKEASQYQVISSASKILSGFYSLPTDLKQFSVNLNGSIQKKDDTNNYVDYLGLTGDAQVNLADKNSPDVGGSLSLLQEGDSLYDKKTNHDIDFSYSGTHDGGQTLATYRSSDVGEDKTKSGVTKLKMSNSDIFSIYDRVIELKDKKDNLLYKYLKAYFDTAEKVTTGLPIMDAIQNKDYTILLNDYIKEVKVVDKTVTLKLASSILNYDDKSGNIDQIIISFDDNYRINNAMIEGTYSDYKLSANINLDDYDASKREEAKIEYNDSNRDSFVDVHGFDLLLQCFITTTEHHFFDLSGDLNMNISLINKGLKTAYKAYITIEDDTVKAYLAFNDNISKDSSKSEEDNFFNTDMKDFYGVEFFIENEFVLSARTTTNSKKAKSLELIKLTPKEITSNIHYYLLSYILHIENVKAVFVNAGKIAMAQIDNAVRKPSDSSSSVTISHNYSSLIDQAVAKETEDGGTLSMTCSLNKLLSIPVLSLEDKGTNINLNYSKDNELTSLNANVKFNIINLLSGDLTFNVNRNNVVSLSTPNYLDAERKIADEKFARYNTFMNAYNNDTTYQQLDIYSVTSITANALATDYKINDNGNKITTSDYNTYKNYFFGTIA